MDYGIYIRNSETINVAITTGATYPDAAGSIKQYNMIFTKYVNKWSKSLYLSNEMWAIFETSFITHIQHVNMISTH